MNKFKTGDRVVARRALSGGEWLNVSPGDVGTVRATLFAVSFCDGMEDVYLVEFDRMFRAPRFIVCLEEDLEAAE